MAKITFGGQPNGTGSVQLKPPNTNSNRVLDLPDEDGPLASQAYVNGLALGVDQTWQDMTASRSVDVQYTNTTGRPIVIQVWVRVASGIVGAYVKVNGAVLNQQLNRENSASYQYASASAVVPDGATYEYGDSGTPESGWPKMWELR